MDKGYRAAIEHLIGCEKAVEAVRKLHTSSPRYTLPPLCDSCGTPYPCPTEQTIREALGEETV